MAGDEPPFLYDPPASRRSVAYPYSDFNPRAVTQAHYAALAERAERQRAKAMQDGKPLINFNQHPDSYMIVGGQAPQYEPMPAHTKRSIAATRWVQLVLRVVEEIGALGLLVCFICLKMALDGEGWILRIAPAWDAVVGMYAIYHLLRPARGRTPGTSASYHFFALFMDTGLIPFYVFTVLLAGQQYNEEPGVEGRWSSFFSSDHTTTLLIFVTFVGGIALSALHFLSIGIDLYLIVMFRRIARLPPDMNPLEDNLTRRRERKHKHKNSEMSTSSEVLSEKKLAHLSGSTLSVDRASRLSTAKTPEARVMPFGHSRVDSDLRFSAHTPEYARLSRQQFESSSPYQDPRSVHSSRQDLPSDRRSRPASPPKQGSFYENLDDEHVVHPQSLTSPDVFDHDHFVDPGMQRAPGLAPFATTRQKNSLLNDNWYILDDDEDPDMGAPRRQRASAPAYSRIPMHERNDSFDPSPLKMNPPTPPPNEDAAEPTIHDHPARKQYSRYETLEKHDQSDGRTMTMLSQASSNAASSVYSDDVPSIKSGARANAGTPKSKYYGDLAAATRGVRGGAPAQQRPATTIGGYTDRASQPNSGRSPSPQKERVISRTGVDITDAFQYHVRSRRDASGSHMV